MKEIHSIAKANASHTHAQSDITGLTAALNGKANSSHTHAQSDITNLTTTLAAKAPLASPTFTGTPKAPTAAAGNNTTQVATTAFVTTAVSSKQATVTGAATTITGADLTASRALVSNSNGKVAVSAVTSTELGYLDGVTSNIQTQLNGKQAAISGNANSVMITDGNGKPTVSGAITVQELNYLNNATSNIQTQLNAKVGYPDWSTFTFILASGGSYTTTADGYLLVYGTTTNPAVFSISEKTLEVVSGHALFPVKSGVVIKAIGENTTGEAYKFLNAL